MHRYLHPIDPDLMWEFGPALAGGHRLVITPENHRHLRPLVAEILRRAPNIPGWEFYAYRLPESIDMALETVQARTNGDIRGSLFTAAVGKGNRIDVTFHYPGFTNEKADGKHFFVAAETLLGEEVLDNWIGNITVGPPPAPGGAEPLSELRSRVAALIDQVHSGLLREPCFAASRSASWTLFKLKPENRTDDYPGQSDMFVGKTMLLEMWKAAHSGAIFSSARFSQLGEIFCYVKLDGREGLDDERFADKSEIEDALDAALVDRGLGCHVGGGTGRWYSYVDLALTDVDRGCEVVRSVLAGGKVPKRSWILFFDDVWSHEWIGIYDDSPPPPLQT
jgi:hypothetical protein